MAETNGLSVLWSGYVAAVHGNFSQDSFQVITNEPAVLQELLNAHTSLSALLRAIAAEQLVHPDDLVDFRSFISPENIRQFFVKTHGKEMHCFDFRRLSESGYRWSVLAIMPLGNYSEDNQSVLFVLKDIQASLDTQSVSLSNVLRALSADYDSIYCLDLDTEQMIPFRPFMHSTPAFAAFLSTEPKYRDLVAHFIERAVQPDQSHVARITDLGFIREYLSTHATFSGEFRTAYDGEVHWYRLSFARIDPEKPLRFVAISLVNISDQKRIEADFYRETRTVLLVDPSESHHAALCGILEPEYRIFRCGTGAEAMSLLKSLHEEISVIIVSSGLEDMAPGSLILRIKAEQLYRRIPLLVACGRNESIDEEDLIRKGAADFISVPFSPALVRNRVGHMVSFRESENLLKVLERDPLTGLFTKEFFFRSAEQLLHNNPQRQYAILISDIEHFHFYKERYGIPAGDELLRNMARIAPEMISSYLIGGRLSDDVFACLIRFSTNLQEELRAMQRSFDRITGTISNSRISVKYGLYLVEENIPVSVMCERAILAVKSIKGVYGQNLAEYNLVLHDQLMRTQQILENAEYSLNQHQFVVYYQPKHDLHSGGVCGAEAVIRWQHPAMGFMNPMSFIPLFERNGFIGVLDHFVLHQVCQDITEWQRRGEPVVPVSINISRVDFDKPGLARMVIDTVDSYGIDHSLIHIEITESGYAEYPELIAQEIGILHNSGFMIELDDFGTGYSSLSALSALPVDVLKLDMSLLREDDAVRNRNILEFSMRLAKIMNMQILQEGVETREELDRVTSLGCDHVQGFYFSKPLPKDKFLAYCRAKQIRSNP